MQYQYRWYVALALSLIILLMGYFYFLQPKWIALKLWRETENRLRLENNNNKQLLQDDDVMIETENKVIYYDQAKVLSDLLTQVHLNGLKLPSITLGPSLSDDEMLVHVSAEGNFQQLAAFIFALGRQAYPVSLLDFSYLSTAQDALAFSTSIRIVKRASQKNRLADYDAKHLRNPFCKGVNALLFAYQQDSKQSQVVPLTLMKMVGYLQQGQRKQALILLPNHSIVAVSKGMVLGKENGVVMSVAKNEVTILLPDKQYMILQG